MTSLLSSFGPAACAAAPMKAVLIARPPKAARHESAGIKLSPEHFVLSRQLAAAAVMAGDRRVHRSQRSSNAAANGKTQQSGSRRTWHLMVIWDHIRTAASTMPDPSPGTLI